mgnify:CR=1 FL=1
MCDRTIKMKLQKGSVLSEVNSNTNSNSKSITDNINLSDLEQDDLQIPPNNNTNTINKIAIARSNPINIAIGPTVKNDNTKVVPIA